MAKTLMLKKTEHYNNIPADFIPDIPERGEVAVFQFKDTIYDPKGGHNGTPITRYPADAQFSCLSRFRNPKNGEWIEIGMVTTENKDGVAVCDGIEREILRWRPHETGGYFRLVLGKDKIVDAMYQYLMLSNEVEDNLLTPEMRDSGVIPFCRYIDYKKKAEQDMKAQDLMLEAAAIAKDLTPDEVTQVGYLLGYSSTTEPKAVIAGVRQFAIQQPAKFLSMIQDPKHEIKARIQEAIDLSVVLVDRVGKKLRWNDDSQREIMALTSCETKDIQEEYALRCDDEEFKKTIDGFVKSEILSRKGSKTTKTKK